MDAYVTGGTCIDCGPMHVYEAWDVVFDTDRLPAGWCDRLGAACGLLHPHGDGPAAAVVTFHDWAAPDFSQAGNP